MNKPSNTVVSTTTQPPLNAIINYNFNNHHTSMNNNNNGVFDSNVDQLFSKVDHYFQNRAIHQHPNVLNSVQQQDVTSPLNSFVVQPHVIPPSQNSPLPPLPIRTSSLYTFPSSSVHHQQGSSSTHDSVIGQQHPLVPYERHVIHEQPHELHRHSVTGIYDPHAQPPQKSHAELSPTLHSNNKRNSLSPQTPPSNNISQQHNPQVEQKRRSKSVSFNVEEEEKKLKPLPRPPSINMSNNTNTTAAIHMPNNVPFNNTTSSVYSKSEEAFDHRATISFDIYVRPEEDEIDYPTPSLTTPLTVREDSFDKTSWKHDGHNLEAIMCRQSFIAPSFSSKFETDFGDNHAIEYPHVPPSHFDNDNRSDIFSIGSSYNPNAIPNTSNAMPNGFSSIQDDDDDLDDNQNYFDFIQLGLLDPKDFDTLTQTLYKIFEILYIKFGMLPNDCSLNLLEKQCSSQLSSLVSIASKSVIREIVLAIIERTNSDKKKDLKIFDGNNTSQGVQFIEKSIRDIARESLINLRQEFETSSQFTVSKTEADNNEQIDELEMIPKAMVKEKKAVDRYLQQVNNVNTKLNEKGDTLVHAVCWYGYRDVLEYLHKEKGANLALKNNDGKYPLDYCITQHNLSCSLYIIGSCHSLQLLSNDKLREILKRDVLSAKKKHVTKSLYQCLKKSKIRPNVKDDFGMTPLHYACIFRLEGTAKILLDHPNLRINEADKMKRTALHLCAITNNLEMIEKLCKRADISRNAQDEHGETFLHCYIRYVYSEDNGPKYENPILLLHKIQTENKWFRSPIVDCGLLLAHAGSLERMNQYNDFVISCWNQIVKFGLNESFIIVDHGLLEGIVDAEVVKFCIISTFKQFITPPKRNHKRPYRMYMGIGMDTGLRKKSVNFIPGSTSKDANYYLKIRSYGSPNLNEAQFKDITESGGRIFYINGVSVRECVQKMNAYLIEAVYKGDITRAKKDGRYDCGAQLELKRKPVVQVKYGKSIKQLKTATIYHQVIDVTSLKTYTFSAIDLAGDLQFLFTDLQNFPEDSRSTWIQNSHKQTPLALAISLIRQLVKNNKVEQNSILTLPISAFKM
ncbi:hypothetical protein C9374_006984 [Naegleria lovaniensis]|uniref:Uncharacterized protein n=1 Tax=Naegleria lovaniensis TaxID=51637 RepID=A0AA88GYN1_NAELO|nr:uncharacterized protein C9374_006984 [Naegleria lovaniensis]KAG2393453.1 hypothetical protein C9374_006984 [Naegleria lovaniensis]